MADNRTVEQRSYNMSMIRSTNTKPEILVRKFLFKQGFRYRLHSKKLVGKPDIVMPKYNTVIFVHGCFWHGHSNCKLAKVPVSNNSFWVDKIETNKKRDKRNVAKLKKHGWKVFVLWECQLAKNKVENTLNKLLKKLLMED
ncbi:MAG: DNA mismatch endonuclease Vsr [Chitinophagaceae bacterium]